MIIRVVKKDKEEAWLNLTPGQRLEIAHRARQKMRKPGINYSYEGMKVKITLLNEDF